jgi:hypothetical protein
VGRGVAQRPQVRDAIAQRGAGRTSDVPHTHVVARGRRA